MHVHSNTVLYLHVHIPSLSKIVFAKKNNKWMVGAIIAHLLLLCIPLMNMQLRIAVYQLCVMILLNDSAAS